MTTIDLTVLAVYVAACTALGTWLGSRSQGLKGYFLAENNVPVWAVMISIVATETSTATFLSVPGVAYRDGGDFTYLQLAFGYIIGRVVVATVLLPAYFRGEIFTAYQLLQDRFGGSTRTTASLLFLVGRSLGRRPPALSRRDRASAPDGLVDRISHRRGGGDHGGLHFRRRDRAVIWTDVIQFSVYIVGAIVALLILVGKLPGGWSQLVETAQSAHKFRLFDFSFRPSYPYTFWAG